MLTFLIFANLYMWLWETLDSKVQGEVYTIRTKYYGKQVQFEYLYLEINVKNSVLKNIT